ncbi:hypothetical protein [Brevundimonas sp.]|uniref:hypothetical protein n=1 Tax=Brevundimonas sp. TaxID=1871086 RepID=UPI0028A254D0|nr:hypothetical protein [Brevundimonas sp.]
MTDTVIAPRAQIEQALALVNDMTRFVGVMSLQDYAALDAVPRNLSAMLAAAPKAEPVSDPYKLGWQPIEDAPQDGTVIDVWREDGGRDTVFWGFPHHDCGEMGRYCDSDWHSIRAAGWVCNTFNELIGRSHNPFTHWKPMDGAPNAQPLSNPQQLDGEDAAWAWVNGRVECDPADIDYSADEMVDAFMAGQASRRDQPEAPKVEQEDEEIGEEYNVAAHCVTLAECPAGLFFWNGSLCFKSEYGAIEPDDATNGKLWKVGNRIDAYCADSGEFFWGGAKTHDERARLIVYPINPNTVAMVASLGPATLAHPAPASDELLKAIDMDDFNIVGEWIESGEKGSAPSGRVKGLWQSMHRVIAIAMHKGPQS